MLAVELGEPDAVGLVADQEVEHGPDQGQAAGLAGEPAHHLGAAFDLAEGPLEQVRAAPPPAMPGGVAEVDDERVQIVGEALRRGGEAALVELVDEGLESLFGVALVDRLIERPPVRLLDAFALAVGELGVQVPRSMHATALAVRGRPALLDRP